MTRPSGRLRAGPSLATPCRCRSTRAPPGVFAQTRQRAQRAFPILAAARAGRSPRCSSSFPVPSTTATFDAGPNPRVQAHRRALAGRGRQQQIAQIAAEHPDGFGLRLVASRCSISDSSWGSNLILQVNRTVPSSQASAGRPRCATPALRGNAPLGFGRADGPPRVAAARPARRRTPSLRPRKSARARGATEAPQRLARVEVVGELAPVSCLPSITVDAHSPRSQSNCRRPPTSSASSAKVSIRIAPRAVERGGHVGNAFLCVDIRSASASSGTSIGSCSSARRQRFEAGFPRDLRLGPALGPVTAGTDPRAAPWSRAAAIAAASSGESLPWSSMLLRIAARALRGREGTAAAPRVRAAACRRARRWLPCGSAR